MFAERGDRMSIAGAILLGVAIGFSMGMLLAAVVVAVFEWQERKGI